MALQFYSKKFVMGDIHPKVLTDAVNSGLFDILREIVSPDKRSNIYSFLE